MSYIGCFADYHTGGSISICGKNGVFRGSQGRLLPFCTSNGTMYIETCRNYAIASGYSVYALQWGVQCFAGNDLQLAISLGKSSNCTFHCQDSVWEGCGGPWSNDLHSLLPKLQPMEPPSQPLMFLNHNNDPTHLTPSQIGIVICVIVVVLFLITGICVCLGKSNGAAKPSSVHAEDIENPQQPQQPQPSAPPQPIIPEQVPLTVPPRAARTTSSTCHDYPPMFICPITQDVMKEPVIASDGHTYEKEAIEKWIQNGRNVSPMTNQPLTNNVLVPNYNLKSAIATYVGCDL